jgi:hypothetical protein
MNGKCTSNETQSDEKINTKGRNMHMKERNIQIANKLLPSFSYESKRFDLKPAKMVEITTTKCGCNSLISIH